MHLWKSDLSCISCPDFIKSTRIQSGYDKKKNQPKLLCATGFNANQSDSCGDISLKSANATSWWRYRKTKEDPQRRWDVSCGDNEHLHQIQCQSVRKLRRYCNLYVRFISTPGHTNIFLLPARDTTWRENEIILQSCLLRLISRSTGLKQGAVCQIISSILPLRSPLPPRAPSPHKLSCAEAFVTLGTDIGAQERCQAGTVRLARSAVLLPEDKPGPAERKQSEGRRVVESSILQGSAARLSTLSEALHCCRGPILSPGTRSLTQMNNHSPYRHVDSIHPGETAIHRNTERQIFFFFICICGVWMCVSAWISV